MNLGILTTLWKRHRLERLVLDNFARMDIEGVDITGLAVGSEGEKSRAVAEGAGFHYLEHENQPLSDKHNAGMQALGELGVDAVLITGSDDLVSESYVKAAAGYAERGAPYVVPQTLFVYKAGTYQCIYCYGFRIGAGRVIRADVLQKIDWTPWPADVNESLDHPMHAAVSEHASEFFIGDIRARGHAIVDVKTATNIWSFGHLQNATHTETVEPEGVLDKHFKPYKDQLLNW